MGLVTWRLPLYPPECHRWQQRHFCVVVTISQVPTPRSVQTKIQHKKSTEERGGSKGQRGRICDWIISEPRSGQFQDAKRISEKVGLEGGERRGSVYVLGEEAWGIGRSQGERAKSVFPQRHFLPFSVCPTHAFWQGSCLMKKLPVRSLFFPLHFF